MSNWINVNDNRPNRGELVIWYHPELRNSRGITHSEYYRVDRFDLPNRPATYWMSLPYPPMDTSK